MPRKATKKVGAGPVKTDDLKVAQSYNPNISDYDSDKEGDVNKTKLKRQYRKRTSKQHTDIKPPPKQTRMPRGYNPSDDSEDIYNPPAKRYGKRSFSSGAEPASKKAKTIVPEKLPNNNEDNTAPDTNVNPEEKSITDADGYLSGNETVAVSLNAILPSFDLTAEEELKIHMLFQVREKVV